MRLSVLLFLLFSFAGQAQYYRLVPQGAWVNDIPIGDLTIQDTACSRGGTEYLLVDRQFHLREQRSYFRMVTRLTTTEAVQNGSRIEVDVDPSYQRLEIHAARIIRNGTVIDQLGPALISVLQRERDLNAYLYDGTRSVVIELQDVRPGDMIEQAYTIIGNDAAGDGRFSAVVGMGYSIPLARQHLRFIVPAGRTLHFKSHLFDEPAITSQSRWGTEYVWSRSDVPCIVQEEGTPDWYTIHPELQASEFSELEELREWAIAQFAVDMSLSNELQQVVKELNQLDDPLARIDSAIHIVQRHVRYLGLEGGISAYRPKPPSKVYAQRFGDCKDRSLLLVAMLRQVGVKAWPVLVNTTTGLTLDRHLARPGLFDHCITLIEHDGERSWVDPTMAHNRGRLHDRHTPDMGLALVIDKEASGWEKMPPARLSTVEVTEHFTLDSIGGGAILEVETRYTHREADRYRAWFAGQSIRSISEQYRDFYLRNFGDGSILEPVRFQDDVVENILVTNEKYQLERIWDSLIGGGVYFHINPTVLKAYVTEPHLRKRESPYALPGRVDVTQRIILDMPEDWPLDISPQDIEGFGINFQSRVWNEGARVEMEYRYRCDSLVVAATDMPAFFTQQQRILDDLQMTYSYADPDVSSDTWLRIKAYGTLLFIMATCIWGASVLYRWDPRPHREWIGLPGASIGGWMILPMIGLMVSPLLILRDMLADDAWILDAPLYVPIDGLRSDLVYHIYNYMTIFQALGMFCLTIVTGILFLQRRTNVPMLMKVIYIGTVVILALDMVFYKWLQIDVVTGERYDSSDLPRAFFAALIWVPFFHFSSRVRTTFVVMRDQETSDPSPFPCHESTAPSVLMRP